MCLLYKNGSHLKVLGASGGIPVWGVGVGINQSCPPDFGTVIFVHGGVWSHFSYETCSESEIGPGGLGGNPPQGGGRCMSETHISLSYSSFSENAQVATSCCRLLQAATSCYRLLQAAAGCCRLLQAAGVAGGQTLGLFLLPYVYYVKMVHI